MKRSGSLALLIRSIVAPLRGAAYRAELQRAREKRAKWKSTVIDVGREAKIFAQIITSTYAHLGLYHRPNSEVDTPERKAKKHKVANITFEKIRYTEDLIWLKVLTRKRGYFGYKAALPVGVSVADLCTEEIKFNLSHACHRHVSFKVSDFHKGFWIKVSRLETIDDLPTLVRYADMLQWHEGTDPLKLPVVLGVGNNREVHQINLADYPHILVAGSSGGGKSNVVNVIISTLMRFCDPSDLKFLLIDLKRMEFPLYEGPHLLKPPILDIPGCITELKEIQAEITRRTDTLSGKSRKLEDWNAAHPDHKLPRIIIVIDEYAVLRLLPKRNTAEWIETTITNIGNLGRAVGIQMLICTQRPAVTVISNAIKINCQLVIGTRTRNMDQSRVIRDDGILAQLPLVPGRIVYDTGMDCETIQAALITDDDIKESIRIAMTKGPVKYAEPEPELPRWELPPLFKPGELSGEVPINSSVKVAQPAPARKPLVIEQVEPAETGIERFVRECCVLRSTGRTLSRTLYSAYKGYAAINGGEDYDAKKFGKALKALIPDLQSTKAYTKEGQQVRCWEGIEMMGQDKVLPSKTLIAADVMEMAAK